MNPPKVTSSQNVVKTPPTLDKIPEDVQLAIIKFIQSWKKSEGTEQERENGKRARDSALRSMALSCRKFLRHYQRELLKEVTVMHQTFLSFYFLLEMNPGAAELVEFITFSHSNPDRLNEKGTTKIRNDFDEISEVLRAQGKEVPQFKSLVSTVEYTYEKLVNIHTLVVHQPDFNFPFQTKMSNGKQAPLRFLTHSLKKLYVSTWTIEDRNFNVRNLVWILVNCLQLNEASLGCVISAIKDVKFLSEHAEGFSRRCNVRKLALEIFFTNTASARKEWDGGADRNLVGGNQKTQAVYNLLKVTKDLLCLELNSHDLFTNPLTTLSSSCLLDLHRSSPSLVHLRLFGISPNLEDPEDRITTDFSRFQNLKVFSMNYPMLGCLSRLLQIKLPPELEILWMPCYFAEGEAREEKELVSLFSSRTFPKLKLLLLPLIPSLDNGETIRSDVFDYNLVKERRQLKKTEAFTSGQVELRLVKPGEESIAVDKSFDFMSSLPWLSPP